LAMCGLSVWLTRRCCLTSDRPLKAGDTTTTRKKAPQPPAHRRKAIEERSREESLIECVASNSYSFARSRFPCSFFFCVSGGPNTDLMCPRCAARLR
jgi:hypothetical protein